MNKSLKFLSFIFLFSITFNFFAMENDEISPIEIDQELIDQENLFKDAEALKRFLNKAAEEGKIPEGFKHIKCARKLEKEHRISRFWTEQLYEILCDDETSWVIKGIREKEKNKDIAKKQITALLNASKDPRIEKFIYPNETDGLQFIFPSYYLSYSNNNEEHFIEVLPKAKGEILHEIICRFEEDPSPEIIQSACKAYFDIGAATSNFYKHLGTLDSTVVHGSLHGSNMVYDEKSRLVTLIDNDRLNGYLEKPKNIGRDIATLFAISPYIISFAFENFLKQIDLKHWYTITLTSYIFGFLSTYEESERKDVFIKLKDLMLKWDTYFNRKDLEQTEKAIEYVLIKNSDNENNLESLYIEQGKTELEIIQGNPDLEILRYSILSES